ncbi:ABZJ_00895 family protein [Celeribacter ethanolicus]|uniref:Uncharacterized protein n=1 Tax=Celeribacter ethanolicus TaxID=1758178 RepID=A0A291GEA9_9RHOB|nr:ABZJ_00895 family protein [Celeribacter ethanolicus]ATG48719.1 hypothetical protein CEW89_14810 [Celeribacter ethanolicus]TNE68033.1 MAG: hypothetical protein EP336_06450 [Paracoccaceae bacterium]
MKVLRYTGILIGLSILVGIVLALLENLLGLNGGTAAGIAAVIGAASFEGNFFARKEGHVPEKAEKRAFARMATLVNLAFGALVFLGLLFTIPELRNPMAIVPLVVLSVLLLLVVYYASGWFFAQSAKNWLKADAKKRAKSQG